MISEELLSAVLGFNPDAIETNEDGVSLDLYELAPEDGSVIGGGNINIYHLAHIVKEWALKEGYILVTYYVDEYNHKCLVYRKDNFDLHTNPIHNDNSGSTYQDLIFKAGEWILKELHENN